MTPRPTSAPRRSPGTEDDLDESMLLAPMLFEDEVLGVLVLSKLGLRQFRDDDLRLLEIYASFAAQAMANADATERLREQSAALEQKVRGQRELLQITESILTTLDPAAAPGHDRRPARRPHRLGQRRRSSSSITEHGGLTPGHGPRRRCRVLPASPGRPARPASRRGSSSTTSPSGSSTSSTIRRVAQPFERAGPRQPRVRAAARPGRRHRRADARAPRRGPGLQRRRVRAGPAVRGPGLDRASRTPRSTTRSERRRPDRRAHRPAEPRHVRPAARGGSSPRASRSAW